MEVLQEHVLGRYMFAAIGAWVACWALALRLYSRQRRRLFEL
jgi:hypothetical protein